MLIPAQGIFKWEFVSGAPSAGGNIKKQVCFEKMDCNFESEEITNFLENKRGPAEKKSF